MNVAALHRGSPSAIPWQFFLRPRVMQMGWDILMIMLSFVVYQWIRTLFLSATQYDALNVIAISAISVVYWLIVFWFGGLHKNFYIRSPFEEFFAAVRLTFVGTAVLFFAIFFDSNEYFQRNPRFVIILYWVVLCVMVCVGRLMARQIQRRLREHGIVRIPAVLVGSPRRLATLIADLQRQPAWGYVVSGVVVRSEEEMMAWQHGGMASVPVLGTESSLAAILRTVRPRDVLVSMEEPDHTQLLRLSAICADENCTVKIVPDLYEIFSGQARTQQIYGSPLIEVSPQLMQPWEEFGKRMLDIVLSALVLVVGAPVWLAMIVVVKLTSKGPVFFIQERVGKGGQIFRMFKFRSMYFEPRPVAPSWTQVNDPRVTPIGRFIRKTHIDEIPQMWNVLIGDMSLVGPRPEQPFYVDKYSAIIPYYRRRLKVRPGITGWWQVKYKAHTESVEEMEDRLRYDFFYIENMSFKLDLEILVRTIFVMVKGHGQA